MLKDFKNGSASKGAVRRRDLTELVVHPIVREIHESEERICKRLQEISDSVEILARQKALDLEERAITSSEEL